MELVELSGRLEPDNGRSHLYACAGPAGEEVRRGLCPELRRTEYVPICVMS